MAAVVGAVVSARGAAHGLGTAGVGLHFGVSIVKSGGDGGEDLPSESKDWARTHVLAYTTNGRTSSMVRLWESIVWYCVLVESQSAA